MLLAPAVTVLGPDPAHRTHVLNGNAFQQDAITSLNGWQYAAYYSYPVDGPKEPLYIHVSRRKLPRGPWDTLSFGDYPQTTDDGHNTVQLGICPGDGTIHLSYDHHCDILRYRYSVRHLATTPEQFQWAPELFTPNLDYLPGLPSTHKHFGYVTYPRFIPTEHDLFVSFRDGKAGLGDDHLYIYRASTGFFSFIGTHLTGVDCNPYVHGMDYRNGNLHVTWVYRGFVWYEGWDDPLDTKHKQQAGPNSNVNNHNICYAYSEDKGCTWKNSAGTTVANLKEGGTIKPDSEGIVAFNIPKGGGLSNQESQTVDQHGGVHILNRDTLDGSHMWKHYYRSQDGIWTSRAIRPIDGNRRGRLAVSKAGDLLLLLPDSTSPTIRILKACKANEYSNYEEVWVGHGLSYEPLVDTARLSQDGILSLFIRQDVPGTDDKNVVVMDFEI